MQPLILHPRCALFHGDCGQLGTILQPNTIDAIVTDPPSGVSFMGKSWDSDRGGRDAWIAWLEGALAASFAALKPGGHALVWALPRTSHWTATALENLGFEIRDVVMHLFGTGFPKSLNVGEGRGTALKPAAEHWILCRKPLAGTVAANVLEFGTGALNIDACRIGTEAKLVRPPIERNDNVAYGTGLGVGVQEEPAGRWPAHVTLDEEAAAMLDEQSGITTTSKPGKVIRKRASDSTSLDLGLVSKVTGNTEIAYGDSGGASRFFYVAKAPRKEKDRGCDALPVRSGGEATDRTDGSAGLNNPRAGAGRTGGARNFHPTVKSVALMRWLVRLITPPGGTVLDPFAGSGTTGLAVLAEGMNFIGCELGGDADEYIPIIHARLTDALKESAA